MKGYIEINARFMPFIEVIEHTKDNIMFANSNKVEYCESLSALIVNIKNALIAKKQDLNDIDRHTLVDYVENLKKSRELISLIINKSIVNIESIIASLPKDNYDSMSKEELIALLREKQ